MRYEELVGMCASGLCLIECQTLFAKINIRSLAIHTTNGPVCKMQGYWQLYGFACDKLTPSDHQCNVWNSYWKSIAGLVPVYFGFVLR